MVDRKMMETHVINDVAVLLEVDWVDCLIISVSFFTIQILRLSTMTGVYLRRINYSLSQRSAQNTHTMKNK